MAFAKEYTAAKEARGEPDFKSDDANLTAWYNAHNKVTPGVDGITMADMDIVNKVIEKRWEEAFAGQGQ